MALLNRIDRNNPFEHERISLSEEDQFYLELEETGIRTALLAKTGKYTRQRKTPLRGCLRKIPKV